MKPKNRSILAASVIIGLIAAAFNACETTPEPVNKPDSLQRGDTITGNPMRPEALKIAGSVCEALIATRPELKPEDCLDGVIATSFSESVGIQPNALNPFRTLVAAEQTGVVTANSLPLEACLREIVLLDPNDTRVKAAYNPSYFNPYRDVGEMIRLATSCADVYKENHVEVPVPTPPPAGTVVVSFDDPAPGPFLTANLLSGIHGGIDFGDDFWSWDKAYDAATSNYAINAPASTFDTGFSFVGGPKRLLRLSVFAPKGNEVITIYDDQGQSVTRSIPQDHAMHIIETGFPKPSNVVYIHVEGANHANPRLGFDDITYELPATPSPIAQIQSNFALWERTPSEANIAFNSANAAGNLIIAQVVWEPGATLTSVTDSLGNTYAPATDVGRTPLGIQQQLWYARNIKAGRNTVTAKFRNTTELSNLYIHEFSGLAPAAPLLSNAMRSGTSQIAELGEIRAPNQAGLLFTAVRADMTRELTFTPDYVVRPLDGFIYSAEKVTTSEGLHQVTVTINRSTGWLLQTAVFAGP